MCDLPYTFFTRLSLHTFSFDRRIFSVFLLLNFLLVFAEVYKMPDLLPSDFKNLCCGFDLLPLTGLKAAAAAADFQGLFSSPYLFSQVPESRSLKKISCCSCFFMSFILVVDCYSNMPKSPPLNMDQTPAPSLAVLCRRWRERAPVYVFETKYCFLMVVFFSCRQET